MSVLTGFNAVFGVIPSDHWNQPDWIDEDKATEARKSLVAANVKYGGALKVFYLAPSLAYRCHR